MELTKIELEIADRHLSKREKEVARWPYTRWLVVAMFSFFLVFGHRTVNDGMRGIDKDNTANFYVDRAIETAPPPGQEQRWAVGTMLKISRILEAQQQVMAASLMQVTLGYAEIVMGLIMACLFVLRWNINKRDALICKLLREKLQELQQAKPGDSTATNHRRS